MDLCSDYDDRRRPGGRRGGWRQVSALALLTGQRAALRDAGLPFAVASNSQHNRLFMKLEGAGLLPYFQGRAFDPSLTNRVGKPAPDLYLYAAAQLGVKAQRCLVIEYSVPGARAGVAAGATVWGQQLGHALPDDEAQLLALGAARLPVTALHELGAGMSTKTRVLLDALSADGRSLHYEPLDVSDSDDAEAVIARWAGGGALREAPAAIAVDRALPQYRVSVTAAAPALRKLFGTSVIGRSRTHLSALGFGVVSNRTILKPMSFPPSSIRMPTGCASAAS